VNPQRHVLVVVGASAGGVQALTALVAGLPVDLQAAVLVVLHRPRSGPSALPTILDRAGPLAAAHAVDGEPLHAGRIYVAPADHHLLVLENRLRLSHGPAENGHRPAVDPLFRSAARAAGRNTVAVVVSGARDDGSAGAAAVAEHGGAVLVQDPAEALHASMPRSVLNHVPAARSCPTGKLGSMTAELVAELATRTEVPEPAPPADDVTALEVTMADLADVTTADLPGTPAGLACPSCHGGLFELPGDPTPRFRCWVGHAWSPESLLDEQAAAFEGALWMALRSLEEKSALARRMSAEAQRRGHRATAERYLVASRDSAEASEMIRDLLRQLDKPARPSERRST